MPGEGGARAKVYRLHPERGWEDLGTGFVFVRGHRVEVDHEDADDRVTGPGPMSSHSLLFTIPIISDIDYGGTFERQQETILTWHSVHDDDIALSFLVKEGCDAIQYVCAPR